MALDVEDAAAVEGFAEQVVFDFPSLDVLVNNAGSMKFEDLTGRRDLGDVEALWRSRYLARSGSRMR